MGVKCTRTKPTRYLDADDIGRLVCAARSNGVSENDLRVAIRRCVKEVPPMDCECGVTARLIDEWLPVAVETVGVIVGLIPLVRVAKLSAYVSRELMYEERLVMMESVKKLPATKAVLEGQYEVLNTARVTLFTPKLIVPP